MDPTEKVQRILRDPVSHALDGITEILSGRDQDHARQQQGESHSVVEPKHVVINPGLVHPGQVFAQETSDVLHGLYLRCRSVTKQQEEGSCRSGSAACPAQWAVLSTDLASRAR